MTTGIHFACASRRSRIARGLGEQLESRILLAVDVFPSGGPDPTPAESPPVDRSSSNAPAVVFADVPNFGGPDNWNLNATGAPESWAHGYRGQGVVVAIVDSGVDATHPALLRQIWSNVDEIAGNGRDDDSNGFVDDAHGWDFVDLDSLPNDESGHGTHLAGIIAGGDIGSGITGVAPDATLMSIRVLGQRNTGGLANIAAGIRYAADNGADIINLSIGSAQNSGVTAAIEYAHDHDVLVVAAAGNDAAPTPTYPAALSATLDNTISVGNYREAGTLGGSSNSVGASGAVQVDAPGTNILSAFTGGGTMYMGGTSMATAHVAGIAALALSANPSLTATELRNLIVAGAEQKIEGSDARGAINAARTVALAEQLLVTTAEGLIPGEARAVVTNSRVLQNARRPAGSFAVAIPQQSQSDQESMASIAVPPKTIQPSTPDRDVVLDILRSGLLDASMAWLNGPSDEDQDDTDVNVWLERAFGRRHWKPTSSSEWPLLSRADRA